MGRGAGDRSARSPCRSTARLTPVVTYLRGHCGKRFRIRRSRCRYDRHPVVRFNGSNSAPKRLAFVDTSAQAPTSANKAIAHNFSMSSGR